MQERNPLNVLKSCHYRMDENQTAKNSEYMSIVCVIVRFNSHGLHVYTNDEISMWFIIDLVIRVKGLIDRWFVISRGELCGNWFSMDFNGREKKNEIGECINVNIYI